MVAMTQEIVLTRGLPASGKSTWATELLHSFADKYVRIERDLLRDQLYGTRLNLTGPQETIITEMQYAMATAAIKAGKSVIVSDMNLRAQYVRQWAKKAAEMGVEFRTIKFESASLEELISRDNSRQNAVGESVIRMLWQKFTKNGRIADVDVSKELANTLVIEPYANPHTLPEAVIVDIDGTLATMSDRSPYEWHRVGEDSPVVAVIAAVSAAYQVGSEIIIMSGRDGSCEDITREWLLKHLSKVSDFKLFMRAEGDSRKDDLVKYELFNENVRDKYHVRYVLDDRDQVVAMWRKLGLATFQVNYGDF
jgi:predicted kinase